jgi:hypothetical protein
VAVNNTLTAVIPTLYAQGLMALRSLLVMPRLVMNDFGTEVRAKGEIIQVPLPSLMTTTAVVPAAYAPDPQNVAPTTASIPLDSWYESSFTLTEKEAAQIIAGIVPMQLSGAMQAMAFQINGAIMGNYVYVGSIVGTPGTTPFASSPAVATQAGTVLTNALAPLMDRKIVLNPTAYGTAVVLPQFAYAMYAGDKDAIDRAEIKQKFGFDWNQDQQVPSNTAGALTGTVTANGAQAASPVGTISSTVSIATAASSSFAPAPGNLITFAGDTQTYSVVSGAALGASVNGSFVIAPGKLVALAGGEAVTITASHVANLAFHKQAFAFASRPLVNDRLGGRDPDLEHMESDPVSGLTMRLIIREEYHRTRVAFDVLWGTAPIRPALACRIAG